MQGTIIFLGIWISIFAGGMLLREPQSSEMGWQIWNIGRMAAFAVGLLTMITSMVIWFLEACWVGGIIS